MDASQLKPAQTQYQYAALKMFWQFQSETFVFPPSTSAVFDYPDFFRPCKGCCFFCQSQIRHDGSSLAQRMEKTLHALIRHSFSPEEKNSLIRQLRLAMERRKQEFPLNVVHEAIASKLLKLNPFITYQEIVQKLNMFGEMDGPVPEEEDCAEVINFFQENEDAINNLEERQLYGLNAIANKTQNANKILLAEVRRNPNYNNFKDKAGRVKESQVFEGVGAG